MFNLGIKQLKPHQKDGLLWIIGSLIGSLASSLIFEATGWDLLSWLISLFKKLAI